MINSTDTPIASTIKERHEPFGFIRSISQTLFGTLSGTDGQYYDIKITELFRGQSELAQLARGGTHLLQPKLAAVFGDIESIKKTLKYNICILEMINKKIMNTTDKIDRIKCIRGATDIVDELKSALSLYQTTFQTLLDVIRVARIGKLYPALIATSNLRQIIRQIEDLHPEYKFPVPIIHARTNKIFEVAPVRLAFRNNKYFVGIKIPSMDKFPTELCRIPSIPIAQYKIQRFISAFNSPRTSHI